MREREETLKLCLGEIEDGMVEISATRDIWQNRLLYALCVAVRLLILKALTDAKGKE